MCLKMGAALQYFPHIFSLIENIMMISNQILGYVWVLDSKQHGMEHPYLFECLMVEISTAH